MYPVDPTSGCLARPPLRFAVSSALLLMRNARRCAFQHQTAGTCSRQAQNVWRFHAARMESSMRAEHAPRDLVVHDSEPHCGFVFVLVLASVQRRVRVQVRVLVRQEGRIYTSGYALRPLS